MKWLAASGIFLTMGGATLLYFYGVPKGNIMGGSVFGPLAIQSTEEARTLDHEEFEREATKLMARYRKRARLGFGMIAAGSLLQLVATIVE